MEKYRIMVKGIVRSEDKYLLVQRWYDDRIEDPYQWEFIDGKLEFGESPDQAVRRVVKEATGLDVVIDKILYTWSFMLGDECNIGISYLCMTVDEDVQISEDYNDYMFVEPDKFEEYIHNPALLEDIKKLIY